MTQETRATHQIEELLRTADSFIRVGDFDRGRAGYRSTLEEFPDHPAALAGIEYADYVEGGRKSRYHLPVQRIPEEVWRERQENRIENLKEFETGRTALETLPPSCHIEHTTKCNFYCPHCSKGYEPYLAADLSMNLIDRFLEGLHPLPHKINITGFGEPTIGSEYLQLMGRIVEKGAIPAFSTNTSTLTVGHIDLLVNSQAHITLSIDGASRETFETIRAGGSWDRLQKVLYSVQRIRSIYQPAGWWGITFVAVRRNIHELPDMVRMAKDFGFEELLVHDYYPVGKAFDEESLRNDPERANRSFDEAEELARDLGVPLLLPPRYSTGVVAPSGSEAKKFFSSKRLFPKKDRFPQACNQPWVTTHVDYAGRVTPCCFSLRSLGSLEEQDFASIWNGRKYRWFRRRLQSFFPPPECRDCHVHEGINQGNPGNAKLGEGMILKCLYKIEILWGRLVKKLKTMRIEEEGPKFFKGKLWRPSLDRGVKSPSSPDKIPQ